MANNYVGHLTPEEIYAREEPLRIARQRKKNIIGAVALSAGLGLVGLSMYFESQSKSKPETSSIDGVVNDASLPVSVPITAALGLAGILYSITRFGSTKYQHCPGNDAYLPKSDSFCPYK